MIKKILKYGVIAIVLLTVVAIIFESDTDSTNTSAGLEVIETEETQDVNEAIETEPEVESDSTEENQSTEDYFEIRHFLVDFGYPEIDQMTDEEVLERSAYIMTALENYGIGIEEMRGLVENYSVTYSEDMTDYEVFMEYGYLDSIGTFVTDAEEDVEDEVIIVDSSNIADWYRTVQEGDYVCITGKIIQKLNLSDVDIKPMVQLHFVGDVEVTVNCQFITNNRVDEFLEGDVVTVYGTYVGKNSSGFAIINIDTIELE